MKTEAFSVFQRKMMDLKKKIKLTIYPKITQWSLNSGTLNGILITQFDHRC